MDKLLDYKLTEAKAELVKGEQSQSAIVNQEAKENITNTITVDEVKELDKKNQCQCEHFDTPRRYYVDDIKAISGELLEKLECGDVVVKHTIESSKDLYHCYFVTHKQATGICLSYFNAGYSETQSYDKIEGVWTYNSQDVWSSEE